MKNLHIICIGSGINSLVCAALLAKAGKKVLILEKSALLGGCIQTETIAGCTVDTLSMAYSMFVGGAAYASLKADLTQEGIVFVGNDTPAAAVTSEQQFVVLKNNRQANIAHFNQLAAGDGTTFDEQMNWVGQHAELLFTLLGAESDVFKQYMGAYTGKTGIEPTLENIQSFLPSVRHDLSDAFQSKPLLANAAAWVLHAGLSPDSAFSATMSKVFSFLLEMVGLPLVQGGSIRIVEALRRIIEQNGGICLTNQFVEEILTENGIAQGVKVQNGTIYTAKTVIANVTPTQLYGKLLQASNAVPQKTQEQARKYKYGNSNMQIHLVLNEKPQWFDAALDKVVYVHLTDGIDAVSKAYNEAKRQLLPEKATICLSQPTAIDPTRSTDGKYVLSMQLLDCPNFPIGDAADTLSHLTHGEWTDTLKEAYADRIVERVSSYIRNLKTATIARKVISAKDLSAMNINLVNGDPYSGHAELDQFLLWRPLGSVKNHETPIQNLYHIGASTHPGASLGGGSGFLVAQKLIAVSEALAAA